MSVLLEDDEASLLVRHALDMLYMGDECCPECCGACHALRSLVESNRIDAILINDPNVENCVWWDDEAKQVRRDFLTEKWKLTNCHE